MWSLQWQASHYSGIYTGIPRFGFSLAGSGNVCFWLLAAVVADDFVDLYDDVLGDAGLYGCAINHLREVDALLVWLSDGHLTEYFILAGNNDTDEITWNIFLP